jgi:molybdate transport system ATP-binding protein
VAIQLQCNIQRGDFHLQLQTEIAGRGTTAIVGPSGSGKTSVLRILAGLDQQPDCEVAANGNVWQNAERWLPSHQRQIGYVFQEANLFPHLSVAENIAFSKRSTNAELEALAKQFGIQALLRRKPATLSGGEKQRVAIARALAAKPQYLLMDEPLNGLDEKSKRELLPYLQVLHQQLEIPLIYVSHSVSEVAQLADRVMVLENGKLQAHDDAATALTDPNLSLAHSVDAGALFDAQVIAVDAEQQLAQLSTAAGTLYSPVTTLNKGQSLRLHIAARDVSLSLSQHSDSSINNILPATIASISDEGESQLLLQLTVGEAKLLARITRHSAQRLDLSVGRSVYAQIKAVAIF